MDDKDKLLVYTAAAHMLLLMMAMVIQSRKRKRREHVEKITYAPIEKRDRMRFEYLNNKIWKNDVTCVNMLRMNRASFFRFCKFFRDRGLLQDTVHLCAEQQVAMFLNTVGHNVRNRLVGTNFDRSGETVSRYFNKVLHAIGEVRKDFIRPPSTSTPAKIAGNPRWDPYFKDCIGAIDGTHVRASIPKHKEASFRGRKSYATQNVMAAVDFNLRFTFVLAGWEGTAHEACSVKAGGGLCQWTPTQSTFVLTFLTNIVADGTKTSTGFKKVHLNACAKALNDHFQLTRTSDQIANHLKTWKKKYTRINYLKNLSAALWNEDEFIISLDHDHYKGHMADKKNKADDEYLNKPLPYYGFLATIFGNSVATGQYAKSSNEPLGTDNGADGTAENEGVNNGTDKSVLNDDTGTSSSSRPAKKAKTIDEIRGKTDGLVAAFDRGTERLAKAIEKASNALPDGLFEAVDSLPGFELQHKSSYNHHLVRHPNDAHAFVNLPLDWKLSWISSFVGENF